jgi:hypothetical protein
MRPLMKRRKLAESPSFLFTAPARSSPNHFLSLPVEVRQHIFSELLQLESLDISEPHWQLALPFERPVVYVHNQEWIQWARSQASDRGARRCTKAQQCERHGCRKCGSLRPDTYWGTAKMSRLFTINRQIGEELADLIYSQFAFYIVPWGISKGNSEIWRTWMQTNNPLAINRICHFQLCLKLSSTRTSTELLKARPDALDLWTELRIEECRELADAFPSLKSVALQIFYEEPLSHQCEPEAHAKQIILLANFFKERNIRLIVFTGPCTGNQGREIVRVSQDQLQQRMRMPILMEQTVLCAKTKTIELGCGEEQCKGKQITPGRPRFSRTHSISTIKLALKWNMVLRMWESTGNYIGYG